ncbi:MAG: hypothetical protein XD73_0931 [Anaerolinea thermophila]|uniref:LysM domain-containing protein n=1 Tax=Anaerolinea thermophila TaxID=167964 RepID=A0A117LGN1_9CHLR|nr:MAG: hypothetical protein XD73_0931 [Anaerolinea thermophila]
MKKRQIILLFVIVSSFTVVESVQAAPLQIFTGYDLVDAVNAYRAVNGLPNLVVDPLLMLSAQMHAEYLAFQEGSMSGHVGVGGTDADARAAALGYPQVPGLDINENWAVLPVDADLDTLIHSAWGDSQHTHTMLHWMGQHVGAGVAMQDDSVVYVLNVAAFWGDAGLTVQPTTDAYPGLVDGDISISQYIAPVLIAEPDDQGRVYHQVLQGQTLWSIATTYGVTNDQIRTYNGLTSESMIYVGQRLLVMLVPTPSAVPPVTQAPLITDISTSQKESTTDMITTASPDEAQPDPAAEGGAWVLPGILLIAVLGFALVLMGQRRS